MQSGNAPDGRRSGMMAGWLAGRRRPARAGSGLIMSSVAGCDVKAVNGSAVAPAEAKTFSRRQVRRTERGVPTSPRGSAVGQANIAGPISLTSVMTSAGNPARMAALRIASTLGAS